MQMTTLLSKFSFKKQFAKFKLQLIRIYAIDRMSANLTKLSWTKLKEIIYYSCWWIKINEIEPK